MSARATDMEAIPADDKIHSPNEASTPMIVSDDDAYGGDEEIPGDIVDESALDCSSVAESDSEWGSDEGDGGVVEREGDVKDNEEGGLSAANLEKWLFSSSSPKEDVVSEDDVDLLDMNDDDEDNMELNKHDNDDDRSPDDETPVTSGINQLKEAAPSRTKAIDAEKAKQRQPQDAPSDKEFFAPVVPDLAVAERKMNETRTSKELELEALRNRGLAGLNSRQLKKTINKNLQIQIDDAQRSGNMEWRKIGSGDDSQDEIQIGTITTGTATTPQLQHATSPASVTSPSMALEQLALEQQKERDRARKLEQETLIQNQLHPESQCKAEQNLLEMDFVFGLLVGQNDPPPEMKAATKAAAKIVPNMLTSKKTIYYDPRYPPKVAFIELDEDYDAKVAAEKAADALGPKAAAINSTLALQKRYMVRGRVPVLPRKRSKNTSQSSSDPKSPTGTTNATISTQPLTPLTAVGSTSNSVCSSSGGGDPATIEKYLAIPSMEVTSPASATTASFTEDANDDYADLYPTMNEEAEMVGVLEGPMNTSADDLLQLLEESERKEYEEAVVATSSPKSPQQPKPNLVVDTRSSSTDIKSIRMSKDAELEAIRQRKVAKQKNLGFTQLEAQSASVMAAYEAEQLDLQKRKSGSKEFQFAAGRIVNPLDQLYLQQNKQNRSYREIQQKTLEEYHRISPSGPTGGGEGGVNKTKEEEEKQDTPFDEEETAFKSNDAKTSSNPPVPSANRFTLQAKDQSSRQSRYDKLFQKIRPKSKKSLQDDELDPIWQVAYKQMDTGPEISEEERQRRYDALFQKESVEPGMDVKSSELKLEQLQAAKQAELKALRDRGLQHKTSDGKIRMNAAAASDNVQIALVQEKAPPTTPSRGGTDAGLLVGFGMLLKKSPPRPPGGDLNLNPTSAAPAPLPTGQAWRASDDASPSRIKHSTLKNKEAEELEKLRQRGLAKRGSQLHAVFEQTSRQSQAEYEKAAQDLARRKSQTSEYVYKGTKDISPVDAVYLEHQKWRKDAMMETKEAVGLFNEAPTHVDQEDVEGQFPVSNAKFTNTNGYQKWESGDRIIGDQTKKKKSGVESKCGCSIM